MGRIGLILPYFDNKEKGRTCKFWRKSAERNVEVFVIILALTMDNKKESTFHAAVYHKKQEIIE